MFESALSNEIGGVIREINFETSTQKERMRKSGTSILLNPQQNSIENQSAFSGHTTISVVPNEATTSIDKVELRHPVEEQKNPKVRKLSTVEPPNTLFLQRPQVIQRSQSENKMLYDSEGNAYTLYSVNPEVIRKTNRSVSHTPTPVLDVPARRTDNSDQGREGQVNQKRRNVSPVMSPQQQLLKNKRPISGNNQQYVVESPYITKMNRQLPQVPNPTRNGGNMVLQLTIPPVMNYELNNNSYVNSITEANNGKRRGHYNNVEEPVDIYMNSAYTNTAYSEDMEDIMRYKPAFSVAESVPRTVASNDDDDDDSDCAPSSPNEKTEMFKKHITIILSTIYALLIVTVGFLLYISDAVLGDNLPAEYFSLYLILVALIFLVYLMWDVRRHMTRRAKYKETLANQNQDFKIECEQLPNGVMQLSVPLPKAVEIRKELPNHYCLSKGKHSGSFYLKIGATVFCLGHLVHSGLLLGYQIVFLTSESEEFFECASVATLLVDILYPLYSFLLLFFLFKYSNVIINRHITIARFGFMHSIASSICFWLWTILRETIDALATKKTVESDKESIEDSTDQDSRAMASEINFFFGESPPAAVPLTAQGRRGTIQSLQALNINGKALRSGCYGGDDGLSLIYKNYSPYLYPFSVEFSILVVGVLFIIWQSIGNCREQSSNHSSSDPSSNSQHSSSNVNACTSKNCKSNKLREDGDRHVSNLVIHADCHAANKGLFSGIVAIMISLVSTILFKIAVNTSQKEHAILVNSLTEIILLSAMLFASILAYKQISRLDINKHPISLLDDLLLFICLPTFFIDATLGILPAVDNGINALSLIEIALRISQVLIQTPLINDGLRRCSNAKELRKEKPGRELITFLIVANVALWFTQMLQIKAHGLKDDRYGFYGALLWTVLSHLTIPLTMFYRFHSSVCLGDIWMHAYEKGGH